MCVYIWDCINIDLHKYIHIQTYTHSYRCMNVYISMYIMLIYM